MPRLRRWLKLKRMHLSIAEAPELVIAHNLFMLGIDKLNLLRSSSVVQKRERIVLKYTFMFCWMLIISTPITCAKNHRKVRTWKYLVLWFRMKYCKLPCQCLAAKGKFNFSQFTTYWATRGKESFSRHCLIKLDDETYEGFRLFLARDVRKRMNNSCAQSGYRFHVNFLELLILSVTLLLCIQSYTEFCRSFWEQVEGNGTGAKRFGRSCCSLLWTLCWRIRQHLMTK